ncbi:MAG: SufS family cysteine desulfurase [Gammaproteobacteria bacterium]
MKQPSFDIQHIRQDFPILQHTIKGRPLVYLDNAATSQKPQCVIDAESHFYAWTNANIHRGVHTLSEQATDAFEKVRTQCQHFINATWAEEIIFTRGTTEAINLVANSYGGAHLKPGDEILITAMEHHANIVPWQMIAERTGARLKVAPITNDGALDITGFEACLTSRTKIVAFVHISNSLGTCNPIKILIEKAHAQGAVVLVDGAQATTHVPIDVQALDCDFYCFSGHKMLGPTGIGVLYGKAALLNAMPPYQGGGEMIERVTFEKTTYAPLPNKFEAGTMPIAQVVGLGAAITYLQQIGLDNIAAYENSLLTYANEKATAFPGLRIIGNAPEKASILSFLLTKIHAHDIGTILNEQGVAVRTGHHCTMPVMDFFGVAATTRASFAFYNTKEEVDALFRALEKVYEVFNYE